MQVLLDECLPRKLKNELQLLGFSVTTVPEAGFAGKTNGELLRLMESKFNVFISLDKNIQYQQNLKSSTIAFILLMTVDSRYETLKILIPKIAALISTVKPSQIMVIS